MQVLQDESLRVDAEVVGFAGERLFLMPTVEPYGLRPGALVVPQEAGAPHPQLHRNNHAWRRNEDRTRHLPMGDLLLGRVIDPNGKPLDKLGPLDGVERGRWRGGRSTRWTASRCANRSMSACARSMRC